jgi:HK97 family phage portal protein
MPLSGGTTVTVQACTDAYAQTLGTLLAYHYSLDENLTRTYKTSSSLARILHKPNSYQTRSDFMLNYVKNLMLRGNGYALGLRNARNEFESLHIIPSDGTMPYVEPGTKAIFYAIGNNPMLGDIDVLVPQRDMMHTRLYTPRHPLIGVTPIEHAAASIAANAAISSSQAAFFNNMSRPSGILSTEQKLNADQMRQLRAAWEDQAKDMDTGGIPILASGIEWNQMGLTSQDSQLVEAFNMTVTDIARAYRVPLPLIQQHDQGSTYNNVEQLYNQWLSGGLGFVIEHMEQQFSAFFSLSRNEGTEFDTDSMLRTDFKGKVEGYTKLVQGGLMTPDEGRMRVAGLKPVPNGDVAYMQQQMVPLGWTAENTPDPNNLPPAEPAPPEPEDDEEASLASIQYLNRAVGYD